VSAFPGGSPAAHGGPKPTGNSRRARREAQSRAAFVAMRKSQVRSELRPSKEASERQARRKVSCTASSASSGDASIL
jgi:hypothetical protein